MDQAQQQLLQLFVLVSLILAPQQAASNPVADVGEVNRAIGWRQIVRDESKLEPTSGSDIVSKDDLRTGEGRMEILFVDESKLRMTEHSRIILDKVVLDPDPSKSSLAMTFAQGTARFVSGEIGRINQENISLRTPSASISIRGTDFTVTVDELGRTLVVLLPDVNGLSSGEIIVSTQMGDVTLNKPFESTTASVLESFPSTPAILDLTLDMLDNIMIISPPKRVETVDEFYSSVNANKNVNPLNIDFLDEQLLEDELEEDLLEYTELDINYLDVDLLEDLLDDYSDLDMDNLGTKEFTGTAAIQGTEEGFDSDTQFSTIIDGNLLSLRREVTGSFRADLEADAETEVNLMQGGKELDPVIINGSATVINIKQ